MSIDSPEDELPGLSRAEAIERASDEHGLPIWYRSCVGPLLELDEARYPSCCGGGCEPCNELLVSVALRARQLIDEAARPGRA